MTDAANVLLLHDMLFGASVWAPLTAELPPNRYRVIAPDIPLPAGASLREWAAAAYQAPAVDGVAAVAVATGMSTSAAAKLLAAGTAHKLLLFGPSMDGFVLDNLRDFATDDDSEAPGPDPAEPLIELAAVPPKELSITRVRAAFSAADMGINDLPPTLRDEVLDMVAARFIEWRAAPYHHAIGDTRESSWTETVRDAGATESVTLVLEKRTRLFSANTIARAFQRALPGATILLKDHADLFWLHEPAAAAVLLQAATV